MRKITKQAVKAFTNRFEFKQSNTEVNHSALHFENGQQAGRNASYMRLHGNLIACAFHTDRPVLRVSFCGWPTPTTKERLNGIFDVLNNERPFHTIGFEMHYNGKLIDDNKWLTFHFVDGKWQLAGFHFVDGEWQLAG
jgi:hypothetical protein